MIKAKIHGHLDHERNSPARVAENAFDGNFCHFALRTSPTKRQAHPKVFSVFARGLII
jgi:hypothetical protein